MMMLASNLSSTGSAVHHLTCVDGLVLPAWRPLTNISTGDVFARGLIYFLSMVYLFLGVSIIADRFMAAIEVITSQEKEVEITKPNGDKQVISVRIWNETVSNLTLMALGSSAPEILLSIIEIYAQDFQSGDLGPGTIVGSAAFNLFVIIAICVWVIPSPEVKKIKHLRVFCVTMIWSVFAYIWLYAILTWSSYGEVTIFEALLTFAFFPATVGTAYIADRRLLVYKYLSKQYRANRRGIIVTTEGVESNEDLEMGSTSGSKIGNNLTPGASGHRRSTVSAFRASIVAGLQEAEVNEFEKHRMEYINILKDVRRKNPDASIDEIEQIAREEIFNRLPKSRAFYRMQVCLFFLFCVHFFFFVNSSLRCDMFTRQFTYDSTCDRFSNRTFIQLLKSSHSRRVYSLLSVTIYRTLTYLLPSPLPMLLFTLTTYLLDTQSLSYQ